MLIVPTKDVRRVHIRTHSCYLQTLPRVAFRLYANNLCLWNQPRRLSTASCINGYLCEPPIQSHLVPDGCSARHSVHLQNLLLVSGSHVSAATPCVNGICKV